MKDAAGAFPYWSHGHTTKMFNNIYTIYPSHLSTVLSKAWSPGQGSLGPVERVGEISPHRSGKPPGTQTENKPRPHVSTEKSKAIADKGKVWSIAQFHFAILQRLSPKVIKPKSFFDLQ